MHARLTQQTSNWGAYFDHIADCYKRVINIFAFFICFDAMHTIYLVFLLIYTLAAMVAFVGQVHTKKLYLGKIGDGTEFIVFTLILFFTYCFPDLRLVIDLNHTWINLIFSFLHLDTFPIIKIGFLLGIILSALFLIEQHIFAKKNC
jgi:phosphatidylglycerophosphate synthase